MSKNLKEKRVINRTTSETLRLGGEGDGHRQTQGARKKIQSSSSFQITGVSVTRVDIGEDSADDLDESHTDDISRVTDNETPSFSEDSRDIDEHAATDLQSQALLQPKQEQEEPELKPKPEPKRQVKQEDVEEQAEDESRFKVVKMPKKVPYNKGRWNCFDYVDADASSTFITYTFSEGSFVASETETPPANVFVAPLLDDLSDAENGRANSQRLIAVGLPLDSSSSDNDGEEPVKGEKLDMPDLEVALKSENAASKSGSAPKNNNIDRKIEEALDAVKSHLMLAVHKEVDFLKTRVSTLEGRVNELEIENSILRCVHLPGNGSS